MSPGRGLNAIALGIGMGLALATGPASSQPLFQSQALPTRQSLSAGGTGAVTALLSQIEPKFRTETGIDLNIVPGLGTSGALRAVGDGKLGLAFSGRALRDQEVARGLKVVATWRTPFGFITSRPGPENFDKAGIGAIYRADRPVWADGTPILIHLRPSEESDNAVLAESFPGMGDALQVLRKRPDLSIAATDQDNGEMAERVKGSLSAATLTQILSEKRQLSFVSIDGVAVTLENFENGSYPFGKSLYVVAPASVSPEAQAFIDFLTKPAVEALLRQAGLIATK